ncbi:hypothetical protein BOQ55_05570 [Lacticaseibacillus casei]|nr:hypothetical protein BOQ55_05570 [Lacticaseibacillus casei]
MSDDEFSQKFSLMLEKFDDDFDSPENIARITKNVVKLSKQDETNGVKHPQGFSGLGFEHLYQKERTNSLIRFALKSFLEQ